MIKCSIVIASRGRPNLIGQCLASIFDQSRAEDIEVLFRVDDDDPTVQSVRSRWPDSQTLRWIVGPRYNGYASLCTLYGELIDQSVATWVMLLNDDMTIKDETGTKTWPDRLMSIDPAALVQPTVHRIGRSCYRNCENTGSPTLSTKQWRKLGIPLSNPYDTHLFCLWKREGLPIAFLPAFAINHHCQDTFRVSNGHQPELANRFFPVL